MRGSRNKCDIMLQLYTAHKVTLRFCKIYTKLRGNPALYVFKMAAYLHKLDKILRERFNHILSVDEE